MELKRKTARLTIEAIPEILQKPELYYRGSIHSLKIENLSPLGVGLEADADLLIEAGEVFFLQYREIDAEFKCICVYSDLDEKKRKIGAYFTNKEDQATVLKYLYY